VTTESATGKRRPQTQVPSIDEFLDEPTRDLSRWRWLWEGNHRFPVRSHRGLVGRFIVAFKHLLRPLVQAPQNDLWDRQRVFNLILLESVRSMQQVDVQADERLRHLETFLKEGLDEVMRHNDALFSRVDQKLDRYRSEARELWSLLQAAMARIECENGPHGAASELSSATEEGRYVELERRFRGTETEIEERVSCYLPFLRGHRQVLDLGCGRGEALAVLQRNGIPGRGVDGSAEMVRSCRAQGLEAERGDLFEYLAQQPAGSLGGIVSFHVIEHLPASFLHRLVSLAWHALEPAGVLILETPNPLSVAVAARNFWLDPTHHRPIHPASLRLTFEQAGFEQIQRIDRNPFPADQRLPEIDVAAFDQQQKELADHINRLRDRLDDMLFGYQDYGMVGLKPS
jgi:SAM-dependent methyltransferase